MRSQKRETVHATGSLRLLLDTAALAWNASDTARANAVSVTFVNAALFATLSNGGKSTPGQSWQIVGEDGKFHSARSLVEPSVLCEPAASSNGKNCSEWMWTATAPGLSILRNRSSKSAGKADRFAQFVDPPLKMRRSDPYLVDILCKVS